MAINMTIEQTEMWLNVLEEACKWERQTEKQWTCWLFVRKMLHYDKNNRTYERARL